MNRILFLALVASAGIASTLSARLGFVDPPVNLQATTPGIQQVGHINVSGKVIAGSMSASDSGPTAQVVVGNATSTTGANFGGLFKTSSDNGTGVRGVATATSGNANGGTFQTSAPTGGGVRGFATSATGVNFGVFGKAASPDGFGVFSDGNLHASGTVSGRGVLSTVDDNTSLFTAGEFTSARKGGIGVAGFATSTNASVSFGGRFESAGTSGRGVYGAATAGTGETYGGEFQSASTSGIGVFGNATAGTGPGVGVEGQSLSTSGLGVFGLAAATSGTTSGGFFQSASTSGRGVFGLAISTSGITFGGRFESRSSAGTGVFGLGPTGIRGQSLFGKGVEGLATGALGVTYGVRGQSSSTSGRGVEGVATAAAGTTFGGQFESVSTSGRGVFGLASAASGATFGGRFESASTSGRGVFGLTTATTGTTFGGHFQSASTSGVGVIGQATATTGIIFGVDGRSSSMSAGSAGVHGEGYDGVRGETNSPGGFGVYGISIGGPSGRGVVGFASAEGVTYSVLGIGNINDFAVFAQGNMGASGTKPFRIDHPHDPENKYLLHYSTESPLPQNFYVGNVVTDGTGYAWVELPDYFAEINANFKYQLTVVDDADSDGFVMAKISKEIRGTRFQLRTSAPNVKVSWRVDADRSDLYVRRMQPKDVIEKQGLEKGTYQHPELYGLGPERGMNYDPNRRQTKSSKPPSSRNKS